MFSRRTILIGASILLLIPLFIFGSRLYCAMCSEESIDEKDVYVPCSPATQVVCNNLLRCNRFTDHKVIAGFITEARKTAVPSTIISETLSSMLSYQSEIYQDRDKWEVLRLRAYILLTLGEIGFPASAIPFLEDALAYIDERMSVVELASAIRVAGNLGEKGSRFRERIISSYNRVFSDEEFCLNRYEMEFSKDEATTIQVEIVRSLGKICNQGDDYAITFLNSILASSGDFGVDTRVIAEAQRSLNFISDRNARKGVFKSLSRYCPCNKEEQPVGNTYIEPKDRREILNENISVTDHDGLRKEFAELIDRPTLLTFFYTRCQNDGKCSATISQLASLQDQLSSLALGNKVRLVAITLEPQHDSPGLLKRYLTDRGVEIGMDAMAIKLDTGAHQSLLKKLGIPVGYNSDWVNSHGIEAVLLDKDNKIVRKYSSLFWNTSEILNDFTRLLKEGDGE